MGDVGVDHEVPPAVLLHAEDVTGADHGVVVKDPQDGGVALPQHQQELIPPSVLGHEFREALLLTTPLPVCIKDAALDALPVVKVLGVILTSLHTSEDIRHHCTCMQ